MTSPRAINKFVQALRRDKLAGEITIKSAIDALEEATPIIQTDAIRAAEYLLRERGFTQAASILFWKASELEKNSVD